MYHKSVTAQSLVGKLKGAHDWILPRNVSDVSFIILEISGESQLTVALEKLNKVNVTQNITCLISTRLMSEMQMSEIFPFFSPALPKQLS